MFLGEIVFTLLADEPLYFLILNALLAPPNYCLMKILVCLSCVPDTTSRIAFVDNDSKLDSQGVQFIIGPYEDFALARAVELKEKLGGTITVINVGFAETEPILRKAFAIGADDGIRVNAHPADSFFVASQIAVYAKGFDLIMMGRESIDFNSGIVHTLVAEILGIPCVSPVMKLDIEGNVVKMLKEVDGGTENVEVPVPMVAGCQEPIASWKIPNMRGIMASKTKPIKVEQPAGVEVRVKTQKFELPPPKKGVKLIDASNVNELVNLLKTEAKVI